MLDYLCTTADCDVIFTQESWFSSDNMYKILSFSPEYTGFGISAMDKQVNSGVFYGRPYGDVAILVNNKYIKLVKHACHM